MDKRIERVQSLLAAYDPDYLRTEMRLRYAQVIAACSIADRLEEISITLDCLRSDLDAHKPT